MATGFGGVTYDAANVFDPSKVKKVAPAIVPQQAGVAVAPGQGVSTTAGAGYYAGRTIPEGSTDPNRAAAIAAPSVVGKADPLAAIKAKDAAITSSVTKPVNAGLTPEAVQRPVGGAEPIAGVKNFAFDKGKQAGGVVANNSRSDWSDGSRNAMAIAGGSSYDEQVAKAKEINANTMRSMAVMSPKEAAEAGIVEKQQALLQTRKGRRDFNPVTMGNAAAGVAGFESRRKALEGGFADEQAQTIAGMKEAGDMYRADQHLAGVKYNADAHTKAAKIAADDSYMKTMQAGQAKVAEQGQKEYADRVKGLVGDWSKLNLPKEYVPKLNEYAKLYTAAEDPQSNTWMMPPNTDSGMYAALPKAYESIYSKLLQGMPQKDAAARVYQLAKQRGQAIDVPDFRRFLPTSEAIK